MKHTPTHPITAEQKLTQLAGSHVVFKHYQLDIQEMLDDEHPDTPGHCGMDCSYSSEAHDLHHQVLLAVKRQHTATSPRAVRTKGQPPNPYDRVVAVMGRDAADALVAWARTTWYT